MTFVVHAETPRHPEIAALLQQSDAVGATLYSGEYRKPLNPESLAVPGVHLLVARTCDGIAAGCRALIEQTEDATELKLMIAADAFRRRGVGAALLSNAEAFAASIGIRLIRMEVGVRNVEGQALYQRAGFTPCGPFATYRAWPISLFFEKPVSA